MKKIILLALTALMVVGCAGTQKKYDGSIVLDTYWKEHSIDNPYSCVIDSCEYICWNDRMAHKGNCRFCQERRQKELEELVIRSKITLEIIYKDGAATDTVVIFKDKEK